VRLPAFFSFLIQFAAHFLDMTDAAVVDALCSDCVQTATDFFAVQDTE